MCKQGLTKTVCVHREIVAVDECLVDTIVSLNEAGLPTIGCCCGHGKENGYIWLKDGRVFIVLTPQEGDAGKSEVAAHVSAELAYV